MNKEYWINVYDKSLYNDSSTQGRKCISLAQAKSVSEYLLIHDFKTLYRIHVKMK